MPSNQFPRLLLAGLLLLVSGCTGVPDGLKPVENFELPRYLGKWYEIARLDHSFERDLVDVSATYSLREDGGVDVLNRGFDVKKGQWSEAKGRAYFLGTPQIASLKVSFFGPFYGGYHVISLDHQAYRFALVSGPTREYLWVLARDKQLPPALLDALISQARQAGFATGNLIYTSQTRQE